MATAEEDFCFLGFRPGALSAMVTAAIDDPRAELAEGTETCHIPLSRLSSPEEMAQTLVTLFPHTSYLENGLPDVPPHNKWQQSRLDLCNRKCDMFALPGSEVGWGIPVQATLVTCTRVISDGPSTQYSSDETMQL